MKCNWSCLAIVAVWAALAAAAPGPAKTKPEPETTKSTAESLSDEELIRRLGDDSWKTREEATRELWRRGEKSLDALKRATKETDPETAQRARDLTGKIELGIRPDTPPEVGKLVREYQNAKASAKGRILYQIFNLKEYWLVLKLNNRETDPLVLRNTRSYADLALLLGTRKAIVDGDMEKAGKFIDMAPEDDAGFRAWAAFHAAQGTARKELKRLRGSTGKIGAHRRMALLLALGDLEDAAHEAESAKNVKTAATIHILLGDPLPWLRQPLQQDRETYLFEYSLWAQEQWIHGKADRSKIDELFHKFWNGDDKSMRLVATSLATAVGNREEVEKCAKSLSARYSFTYFNRTERFAQGFRILGGDPESSEIKNWIKQQAAKVLSETGKEAAKIRTPLWTVCGALEARGLGQTVASCLAKELDRLADENSKTFLKILGEMLESGIREAVIEAAGRYAGADPGRWNEVRAVTIEHAGKFAPKGSGKDIPAWIDKQTAKLPAEQRLRILMALTGMLPGEAKLRGEWIDKLRNLAEPDPDAKARARMLRMLMDLILVAGDARAGLEVGRELAKADPDQAPHKFYLLLLVTGKHWDEALAAWKKMADLNPTNPWFHTYLACIQRQTGHDREAREIEHRVELMALGDAQGCFRIGAIYAIFGDFTKVKEWWRRSYLASTPQSTAWSLVHGELLNQAFADKDWKLAAALSEVAVYENLRRAVGDKQLHNSLAPRFDSDFARAMLRLPSNRADARQALEHCADLIPFDSKLANTFLPALRRAGFDKLARRCFERYWKQANESLQHFPDAPETLNNAAWLAARSGFRLDEAGPLIDRALALLPNHPGYLDTRAELWFALGDRRRAVEYSRRAVAIKTEKSSLLRQLVRFQSAPLPRRKGKQ